MRHKKKGNHLSRTTSHRKALLRNMAAQVIEHKEIKTTVAKARELRGYVERLVTYGKKGTLHHRRLAFKLLQNKEAVKGLFDEVAPTFETREGGYTRIIKLGNRRGDGAPMSILQLVGFEKSPSKSKSKAAKKDKKKSAKESASAEVAEEEPKVTKQAEETSAKEEKSAKEAENTEALAEHSENEANTEEEKPEEEPEPAKNEHDDEKTK
jgi:large subunit ribosomal protein L17